MKIINKYIVLALLLLGGHFIKAQQVYQLTSYMMNDLAYNPAVAGSTLDLDVKLGYRNQWTGFDGAPKTFFASAHTNVLESKKVGLGGLFFSDITGPTRRTGFNLSYAYHLLINQEKQTYLSFGLAGTLVGYRIDYNALNPEVEEDAQLLDSKQSKATGDANFGINYYNDRFFAGFSMAQLMQSKIKINELEPISTARHYFLMGGYRFDINDKISVEPSTILKMVKGIPLHADFNARVFYDKQYWAGLSYRTHDAIAILLGVKLNNGISATYGYDITTSKINKVSNGTHEIALGYRWKYRDSEK